MIRKQLPIDDSSTFETHDTLDRKEFALGIKNVLDASSHSTSVAIEGPWGSGKTHLLKLWRNELRQINIPCVYVNCFDSDRSDDPFVELVSAVTEYAKLHGTDESRTQKFVDAAAQYGRAAVKASIRIGVKALSAGVIDASDAGAAFEAAIEETDAQIEESLRRAFKAREEKEALVQVFQKRLREVLVSHGADSAYAVLIIDELDRCRPTFALGMMEAVKHVFETDGVHFVFGCNSEALARTINHTYGLGRESESYLSRFFDYRFNVPSLADYSDDSDDRGRQRFVQSVWNEATVVDDHSDIADQVVEQVAMVSGKFNLSLRQIRALCARIELALIFTPSNYMRVVPVIVGLLIMQEVNPSLYRQARDGSLTWGEASEFFQLDVITDESPWAAVIFRRVWRAFLIAVKDDDAKEIYTSFTSRYHVRDRGNLIQNTAVSVIERLSPRPRR